VLVTWQRFKTTAGEAVAAPADTESESRATGRRGTQQVRKVHRTRAASLQE
jgi:hypothetical protein